MLNAVLTSPGFYTTEEPPTLKLIYNPVRATLAAQNGAVDNIVDKNPKKIFLSEMQGSQ